VALRGDRGQILVIVRCCSAQIGSQLQMFRDNLWVPSARVKQSKLCVLVQGAALISDNVKCFLLNEPSVMKLVGEWRYCA